VSIGHDRAMDATAIDQEFEQLQAEFQDVAKTVQDLAQKMQAAEKAGDADVSEWLAGLKQVAQDIDDEQAQVKKLLLAIHDFVGNVAQAQQDIEEKPPLFAPGHEPPPEQAPQQPQRHGTFGGLFGGGGLGSGYYGGSFGQAMAMGAGMSLGANLVSGIFR
jgi:hypothetical protein